MSRVLCAHGAYHVNPENATYVKEGVPMCHEETCRKVLARLQHRLDQAFEEDRMPDEVYSGDHERA